MKNKKKTLLLLIAAVLLVAAALVLTTWILRNTRKETGPVQTKSCDVLSVDVSQIDTLTVHNRYGERYRIALNGSYAGILEGVDEEVELDTMILSQFISKFTAIKSYHDAIPLEKESDLDSYGLGNPAGSVEIRSLDGSAETVLVGAQTVKKNGYYLYVEGEDAIYVVENAYFDYLDYTRDDFISKQLAVVDQDNGFTVTRLSIRNRARDYDAITIQMRFGAYEDNSIYLYEVTEPEYHAADDYKILENVFAYLKPLKGVGVYSLDTSEENLESLGLSQPQYTLSFINEGVERQFHFSQLESGEILGMKDGGKVILEMEPSLTHLLNIQVADVANAYVLLQNVSELSRYTVNMGGESHVFDLSSQGDKLSAVSCRGRDVDVERFRDLYSLGLDIKVIGDVENPEAAGSRILNITYHCKDGTVHSVDYFELDGRYGYAELDGSGRFTVRLSAIEAFEQCLNSLMEES